MERTFLCRQNEAQEGTMKVDVIIDKYFALQFTAVLSTEHAHFILLPFLSLFIWFCLVKIFAFRCLAKPLNWTYKINKKLFFPMYCLKIKSN